MIYTRKRDSFWIVFAITMLIIIAVAYSVAMIWWLVWSILDLVHGNPATGWNICGIILPSLSIIGGWVSRR